MEFGAIAVDTTIHGLRDQGRDTRHRCSAALFREEASSWVSRDAEQSSDGRCERGQFVRTGG